MAVEERTVTLEINASPRKAYEIICDFEGYPEWQSAIEVAKVITRYEDGRPKEVEFLLNAIVRKIRYILDYTYNDRDCTLSWTMTEGDIKDCRGSYTFTKVKDKKCLATYTLLIDPGLWVPKIIAKKLYNVTMKGSIKDLKDQVEGKK